MSRQRYPHSHEGIRLPQPPAPGVSPQAFVLVPLAEWPGLPGFALWQQWVYAQAFAEAAAVVQPSLPERDLLGVWN